jgi:WD40 repeat protein
VLEGHSGDVFTVAWSPDGLRVTTGSADKTSRVWDVSRSITDDSGNEWTDMNAGGVDGFPPPPLGAERSDGGASRGGGPLSAESSGAFLRLSHGSPGGTSQKLVKLRTMDR